MLTLRVPTVHEQQAHKALTLVIAFYHAKTFQDVPGAGCSEI